MTLGDKIRSMTDRELAHYIAHDILMLEGVGLATATEAWFWKLQREVEE